MKRNIRISESQYNFIQKILEDATNSQSNDISVVAKNNDPNKPLETNIKTTLNAINNNPSASNMVKNNQNNIKVSGTVNGKKVEADIKPTNESFTISKKQLLELQKHFNKCNENRTVTVKEFLKECYR